MVFAIKKIYQKAVIVGILGVLILLLAIYSISVLTYTGQSDKPHDVVEGWAAMFFMAVAAVCSFFLIGMASAWWAGKETASIEELIKASLISGIVTVTILAVIVLVTFNIYLTQLLQLILLIFGLFYIIAIIFSALGALFYVFIFRGLGSSLANDTAAYLYSLAAGLITGSISMGFIVLTWNGLNYITILQLSADILIFSAMAVCAGIIVTALLGHKKSVDRGPVFPIGVAGLIVGALTFTAPLASVLLRGGSIRGASLVFYFLVFPLPIAAAVLLALTGGALASIFMRPVKTTDMEIIGRPLPGLFHIKLGLAGGILMALLMFSPILVTGDTPSQTYYQASNIITMASFFIVPAGEAIIGMLAVRHSRVRSMREAAAAAAITGAISVFILFMGDMAKNILHLHSFVSERHLLDMYAYGSMTNVIMCYPFVLLALLTIAVCSGVFEYGREQRIK
jgi:hypothetical protein